MGSSTFLRVSLVALLAASALATFNSVDDDTLIFDYIVIGAGTAGSSVAKALSDVPTNKVLVIDTGSDQSNTMWTVPSIYRDIFTGIPDHQRMVDNVFSYEKLPDVNAINSRSLETFVPRDALGGASAFNGNFPQRTTVADHNLVVALTGDSRWSFDNTKADWCALENWNSSDPLNKHCKGGPVTLQTFQERQLPIHQQLHATMAAVLGIPVLVDGNVGNAEGVAFGARNIAAGKTQWDQGVRQDAWTRILKPVLGRPNLLVKSLSKAIKVNFRAPNALEILRGEKKPKAESVEFFDSKSGKVKTRAAIREIILSSGVFSDPQILLSSGVGPAAELNALGIDVVINNPNVGRHLVGNVGYLLTFVRLGLVADPTVLAALANPTIGALLANPTAVAALTDPAVLALLANPTAMAALMNPAVQAALATGNVAALAVLVPDPAILALLTAPSVIVALTTPAIQALLADPVALGLLLNPLVMAALANPTSLIGPISDPNTPYGIIQTAHFKAPGSNRTDLELSANIIRGDQVQQPVDTFGVLLCQNVVPVEGKVTLRNRNPFATVNITYGYFDDAQYIKPMIHGFKKARQVMAAMIAPGPIPFPLALEIGDTATMIPATMNGGAGPTDAEIGAFLKAKAQAEWHDTATCRMGKTIANSVTDSRMRVHGVRGLRVISNAALPVTPASHSCASWAFLLGRVGGRFVLEDN